MSDTESDSESMTDNRHKRLRIEELLEEKALEDIVFGRQSDLFLNIKQKSKQSFIKESDDQNDSEEDSKPHLIDSKDNEDIGEEIGLSDDSVDDKLWIETNPQFSEPSNSYSTKRSVWVDDDDSIAVSEGLKGINTLPKKITKQNKYKEYLENKFLDLYKTPKWAQKETKNKRLKDKEEESDSDESDGSDGSDDELMRTAQNFKIKSTKLEKGFLAFKKCTHLTNDNKMKSSINCVEFHPTSTVALVSSPNGTVRLFQVDGKINSKIQSIHFKDFRIEIAKFNKSGEELIVGSKRDSGFFLYYDMIAGKIVRIPYINGREKYSLEKFVLSNDEQYIASKGKNGFINILTQKSKEHIFDLKMNGDVLSLAFSNDSNMLLSHGNGGKVYVWDIRKRQCINRFTDEGCVSGTSIAVSRNSQYFATGSDMGVVNVYNLNDVLTQSQPKPLKALMNLTTQISTLKFNHSSELLFMASNAKDNSIRCVHMSSLSVYSNFPFAAKNYGRIYDSDVSLNSGYLAFGNNNGTAHLFRLNSFTNY